MDRLRRGESVASVSDAGTPGVSDPGAEGARVAVAAGVRVEAVPGASAVMAALSTAGLPDVGFTFLGFPPIRETIEKAGSIRSIEPWNSPQWCSSRRHIE